MRVLYDTFTEGSDTALGSHTPDERPGSESWTVTDGGLDVIASTDRVQGDQQAGNIAGINYAMTGDFDVSADIYMSDTGNVASPTIYAFSSTAYAFDESCFFRYEEDNAQYVLGYESTNDGIATDTFASATPSAGTTIRMERSGNTLNGYVDDVLRCTLSVASTDFAGANDLYPGLGCLTFSADRPALDNFEVTQPGYIVVGTTDVTVTTFALTVTTGGFVTVGTTDVTVTTYPLTVSSGVVVGTADVVVTTFALAVNTTGAALSVGGVPIDVHVDGAELALEPMAPDERRAANGASLRSITSARGYKGGGRYRTIPLSASAKNTQLAALTTGIPESVSGWLAGGATTAMAEGVAVEYLRGVNLFVISFNLTEST